ncbi:site-specific integrase [Limosilactobacillus vaginalis]|uniref:Site-specific integrase n=1 Tax=Limosilactobacillus vaginalis TaxID=1633 RepID=A0ABT4K977_9LACO|nr:site-specific integrase [Limosilactobacillus vaginalis]MCZ3747462.1 site-specific integrase [Limosilactobacillus vaginalis]MCZ3752439.1 site-specific integrase [Limosilactobacillus vaginalis]MCZ3754164.1 site-specific integrase [Limosilactobacillus vaginalis]MCZ3755883.1 site-specific integrase [Limosilactobacillus vaginalis]MCZ3757610.1 site-specific integrase [Limosilactobacillus vaginalis]
MAQIVKRGKSYMVRVTWRDASGKQYKKSKSGFKTKAAARAFGAKLEMQKYNGVLTSSNPTFLKYYQDWYNTYKKNNVSTATAKFYQYCINVINRYFGSSKLENISRRQYQLFINEFGKSYSKMSVSKVNSYLKTCVKSALADGLIHKDFTANTQLVWNDDNAKKVQYLSISELNKLIKALKDNLSPYFTNRYMILTAIYTGMRLSEIAGLTWDDINFNFKTITINKSWDYLSGTKDDPFKPTKTKSSNRVIHANDELLFLLSQLKGNDEKLVFMNPTYNKMPGSSSVNRTLRTFLKKCNIDKANFHFHSLRHSHVAYLLANGVPLYSISKRLGHSNITTTANRYAYLIDEYKTEGDKQIDKALSKLGVPKSVPTSQPVMSYNN